MEAPANIVGSDKLTSIFGYWPLFHDSEVVWLHLDRGATVLGPGPTLEAMVNAFEMTNEVDADGSYVLRKHVLVHFRFSTVTDLKIDEFNQQNALFSLWIRAIETPPVGECVFCPPVSSGLWPWRNLHL